MSTFQQVNAQPHMGRNAQDFFFAHQITLLT